MASDQPLSLFVKPHTSLTPLPEAVGFYMIICRGLSSCDQDYIIYRKSSFWCTVCSLLLRDTWWEHESKEFNRDTDMLYSGNSSLLKFFVGNETQESLLHEKILTWIISNQDAQSFIYTCNTRII